MNAYFNMVNSNAFSLTCNSFATMHLYSSVVRSVFLFHLSYVSGISMLYTIFANIFGLKILLYYIFFFLSSMALRAYAIFPYKCVSVHTENVLGLFFSFSLSLSLYSCLFNFETSLYFAYCSRKLKYIIFDLS